MNIWDQYLHVQDLRDEVPSDPENPDKVTVEIEQSGNRITFFIRGPATAKTLYFATVLTEKVAMRVLAYRPTRKGKTR